MVNSRHLRWRPKDIPVSWKSYIRPDCGVCVLMNLQYSLYMHIKLTSTYISTHISLHWIFCLQPYCDVCKYERAYSMHNSKLKLKNLRFVYIMNNTKVYVTNASECTMSTNTSIRRKNIILWKKMRLPNPPNYPKKQTKLGHPVSWSNLEEPSFTVWLFPLLCS